MAIELLVKIKIIPNRLIFKNKVHIITDVHPKFIINSYKLQYNDERILTRVILDAQHPNSHPNTNVFCLPDNLIGKQSDKTIIPLIESLIATFNFESSYFQPWSEFEYEEGV